MHKISIMAMTTALAMTASQALAVPVSNDVLALTTVDGFTYRGDIFDDNGESGYDFPDFHRDSLSGGLVTGHGPQSDASAYTTVANGGSAVANGNVVNMNYLTPSVITAQSSLNYLFEIHSSTPTAAAVLVPVTFNAFLHASGTGLANVRAAVGITSSDEIYRPYNGIVFEASLTRNIFTGNGSRFVSFSPLNGGYSRIDFSPTSVSIAAPLTLMSETLYYVSLDASVDINASFGSFTFNHGEALADPSFTIDPAFASEFQIYGGLLGPSIPDGPTLPPTGPVVGVPEPMTWTLLIAGFGAVGVAARRRRETVAA